MTLVELQKVLGGRIEVTKTGLIWCELHFVIKDIKAVVD